MREKKLFWKLKKEEIDFFSEIARERKGEGKPYVLWGWKRDKVANGKRYPESRTVYFSADFRRKKEGIILRRVYFFLETRAKSMEIDHLRKIVGKSRQLGKFPIEVKVWQDSKHMGYGRLRMEIGEPTEYDRGTVARRLRGKPRLSIKAPKLIEESGDFGIRRYVPLALYCGSGLSSESGLPLLGEIHEVFEVDNIKSGKLIFGASDKLPGRIISDIYKEFRRFCEFSIQAIRARPEYSHEVIAKLYREGVVGQVFTDNVDDVLRKVKVPYIQTRQSIFPDRFPVKFDSKVKSLLVIGIAVDRRDVIRQARRKGLNIVVINPVYGVAPYSRNMDYLCKGDIFFKGKAKDVFPKIIAESYL